MSRSFHKLETPNSPTHQKASAQQENQKFLSLEKSKQHLQKSFRLEQTLQYLFDESDKEIEEKHKEGRDRYFEENPNVTAKQLRDHFEADLSLIKNKQAEERHKICEIGLASMNKSGEERRQENKYALYVGLADYIRKKMSSKKHEEKEGPQKDKGVASSSSPLIANSAIASKSSKKQAEQKTEIQNQQNGSSIHPSTFR